MRAAAGSFRDGVVRVLAEPRSVFCFVRAFHYAALLLCIARASCAYFRNFLPESASLFQ